MSQSFVPGAFGWDDTASIVPTTMVPSYTGTSPYLLMVKYNNYARIGGDGVNKIAIVDPYANMTDLVSGETVMKEILTIAGVTPDEDYVDNYPNAVREWCINTAVVDPFTGSVLANNEDGKLYRWDLSTNSFTQVITLTAGLGEAYTPTLIGVDGTVYAINNAILFAVRGVRNRLDVSGNGSINADDALLIINFINAYGSQPAPTSDPPVGPYYDVTGDGFVAPDDALDVIDYINANPDGEGEPNALAKTLTDQSPFDELIGLLAFDAASPSKRRA